MPEHHIGTIDEFTEGEGVRVTLDSNLDVAVFNVDGELYAILDNCLHMNYPLHEAGSTSRQPGGVNEKTCSIKCPWHGLEWSLEDGYNATLNKNLPTFDVETRGTEVYLIR